MSVSKTLTPKTAIQGQYDANSAEYRSIERRIHSVRGYILGADRDEQLRILRKAYVYAVLTGNAKVRFADEAYGKWLASDDIYQACRTTPAMTHSDRGKAGWISDTLEDWEDNAQPVLDAINAREWFKAGELAYDNLKGCGRIKGHFTVALLTGKTACIDTHTADFLDSTTDLPINKENYNSISRETYAKGVETLENAHHGLVFAAQWIAFDRQRDEPVETHDLFYDSLNIP